MAIALIVAISVFLFFLPFILEKIIKRINPDYETYSEFLAKMSDEERAEYSKIVRKYKHHSKMRSISTLSTIHRRVKPNYRRR